MLIKYIMGEASRIDKLRLMVKCGAHGRAHKYADHVWIHYNDHTYMEQVDFYREHALDRKVNWGVS